MTFSEIVNSIAPLLVLILGLLIYVGLFAGFRQGGGFRNLPYVFALFLYLQYLLVSPFFFFLTGKRYIIGTDISEFYGLGFFYSIISVLSFLIGYWILGTDINQRKWKSPSRFKITHKTLAIIFYVLYGVILINMAISGISLQNVFFGSETLGLGAKGETYFLQNFADSLITLIVIAYIVKIPRTTFWIWLIMSFFLFTLLGFRYRIILTLFGLLFGYVYMNKFGFRQILVGVALSLAFFYSIMFVTENRFNLISRNYGDLSYNPTQFRYAEYFEQTRGALADMAIYKLYNNPNKTVDYDYGVSMFGYIFIRIIPRSIYPEKDRFYPPPQNKILFQAYDAWWGNFSGEANLSPSTFYMAFGWLGIVFGHFIWGFLLRRFSNSIIYGNVLSIAKYIVIALVTFQWITRAYFPQTVDHAVYLLIPVWLMYYLNRRANAGNSHTG